MIPTYDVECVEWDIPISVGLYDGWNYYEFIKETESDDVMWRFLSFLKQNYKGKGLKLYAHYAAKFDNRFVLASLSQHGEVVAFEAGLAKLKWVEPNISFEDSYLLVPMSLEKMCKMLDVEEKGKWEHDKQLRPWEMGEQLSTFREYQRRDCMSLSHAMSKLCEILGGTFGVMPSISISTTATKVFDKCFYPLDSVESNEEVEEFIRASIYGARNEVYKRYGENINLYDINAMYPSCYNTPVPVGKLVWTKCNLDRATVVEATVKVPKDLYIGPLPYNLNGRLVFPVGEFRGWWDARELRNATELGVDVSVRRQLTCDEEPILKEFGEFVIKLKRGKLEKFWKTFGVSLYGKLGQSRWRDVIRHVSEIKDMEGYFPLDKDETYFQTSEYVKGRAPYIKPAISMRIRAEARIRHLKYLLDALQKGDVYYCDTDSVHTSADLPTSGSPGELSRLYFAKRGYYIRQKLYGLVVGNTLIQRSSGFSDLKLREEDFVKLLNGGNIAVPHQFLSPPLKVLKHKEVNLIERTKLLRGEREKDNRVPIGNDTEPICLPLKHATQHPVTSEVQK